jgi:2-amino-4-hydroxy-6-hydroxymethyldihydropteridine diphosphokinase
MTKAFVGLGSNLGDREEHLRHALNAIRDFPRTELVRVSSYYETEPVGEPGHPHFLNAVALLETELSAGELWWNLRLVERREGRPAARRSGPRTLDLDLLYFGDALIEEPDLTVPHPRIADRLFVLVPLAELDPEWQDPRLGVRIGQLLRRRRGQNTVRWAGRYRGESS